MKVVESGESAPAQATKTLSPTDELALLRLVALYAHIIDEREFQRASELFTDDAVLDLRPLAGEIVRGAKSISELWARPTERPLLHHATNAFVEYDTEDSARITFKGIGVGRSGKVGSALYRTAVRRTPDGWRFVSMVVAFRKVGAHDILPM